MDDSHSNGESSSTNPQIDNQPDATSSSASSPAASSPPTQKCANCNKCPETPLKDCNKCHSVQYCSRDCQKADLKKHKKVCAAAAQIYAQTAEFKPAVTRAPPKDGHQRGLQKWQFDT